MVCRCQAWAWRLQQRAGLTCPMSITRRRAAEVPWWQGSERRRSYQKGFIFQASRSVSSLVCFCTDRTPTLSCTGQPTHTIPSPLSRLGTRGCWHRCIRKVEKKLTRKERVRNSIAPACPVPRYLCCCRLLKGGRCPTMLKHTSVCTHTYTHIICPPQISFGLWHPLRIIGSWLPKKRKKQRTTPRRRKDGR